MSPIVSTRLVSGATLTLGSVRKLSEADQNTGKLDGNIKWEHCGSKLSYTRVDRNRHRIVHSVYIILIASLHPKKTNQYVDPCSACERTQAN